MNINKKVKMAVAAVVIAACAFGGYQYYQTKQAEAQAAAVETAKVVRMNLKSTVSATGTIKPVNSVEVSPKITARISQILVKENDHVTAGQTVAILDGKDYQAQRDQAQFRVTNTLREYNRAKELYAVGADTKQALDNAEFNYDTAVSQLNEAWDQINNNTTAITNIGNKVGELDSRIDEVGAGAAALAALHPLDFDPDDKWDFAAGYGNYRGENAVAIGAFYRPNEDTMFSVGGTVGNDDNMVNAGVSFKIGQGNGVSTSRVAMAKEIKDLRKELEAMKSAMLDVNAGRRLDTSKLQLFPDVPQNHWAYEYVAILAGNGVIEGYPDGNFDGARPMTRYEFAAMLYKAMLNGAKLSDKILTEFAPELERFTVDVVHKDKDGNPTVERVRVVKRDDAAK